MTQNINNMDALRTVFQKIINDADALPEKVSMHNQFPSANNTKAHHSTTSTWFLFIEWGGETIFL